MFRDKNEALKRLEEALLEEEDSHTPAEEPPEDSDLLSDAVLDELLEDTAPAQTPANYQNYSNAYGLAEELDPEEYDRLMRPKKKDRFGWLIVVVLVLMLALILLVYTVLHRGGLL